ncbi:MAG: PEP-CTERM sorting domain-containing protein [Alphaproteobacteria bacterium]
MKKQLLVKILVVSLLMTCVCVGSALAGTAFPSIYMSKSVGGAAETTFGLNDTPYLHLELPGMEGDSAFTGSFWNFKGFDSEFVGELSTSKTRWLSLDNWSSVVKEGNWAVSANYFYPNGATASQTIGFTVTPEPMAMVLFLVGGLPLGFNLLRKRS